MGFLARSGVLLSVSSAACYAPEVRDCTLKCESVTDCADEQVCNAGYCVRTTEVDCATLSATTDAGMSTGGGGGGVARDAGASVIADAATDAPTPDATTHGTLTVEIDGKGTVFVPGIGVCVSAPQPCEFMVPLAATLTAYAIAGDGFELDEWTTSVCPDADNPTCSFMPELAIELGVKFRKDH